MRAALRICLVAALGATVGACTRAPSDDALKADLQKHIEASFPQGLIEVDAAHRATVFSYLWAGAHVGVGFDATLRLKRDHRFAAWDQINVGALSLMLDAAPEEINGVKAAGNAAGDLISVRGRLAYLSGENGLTLDTQPPSPVPELERDLVLVQDLKNAMETRWRGLSDGVRKSKTGLGLEEWRRARRAVAGRSARLDGGFSVATGVEGSADWKLGRAVEREARERGVAFANIAPEGSQEALDFLRGGRVSAAVLRNTEAALAVSGAPPFEASGPYRLSVIAALYPQPIHVIVKDASPLGSPADLFGKHVGVAGTARADAVEAEAILRGHGVPLTSLAGPFLSIPAAEALDQLEAGAFDALIMTSALPNGDLRAFAGRRPIRLLPFDGDAIALLTGGSASYVDAIIPAHTYPGQTRPLAAVAAVTMLVSVGTVPVDEAAGLAGLILSGIDYVRLGSLTGALISRATAERAMTLPWHPGAVEFFSIEPKE